MRELDAGEWEQLNTGAMTDKDGSPVGNGERKLYYHAGNKKSYLYAYTASDNQGSKDKRHFELESDQEISDWRTVKVPTPKSNTKPSKP